MTGAGVSRLGTATCETRTWGRATHAECRSSPRRNALGRVRSPPRAKAVELRSKERRIFNPAEGGSAPRHGKAGPQGLERFPDAIAMPASPPFISPISSGNNWSRRVSTKMLPARKSTDSRRFLGRNAPSGGLRHRGSRESLPRKRRTWLAAVHPSSHSFVCSSDRGMRAACVSRKSLSFRGVSKTGAASTISSETP